jgi:hypothetical protein
MLLDSCEWIDVQPPHDLGAAEDAMQLDQQLVLAAIGEPGQRAPPASISSALVASIGRSPKGASRWAFSAERYIAQRRGLPLEVLLDESEPLRGSVGEAHARAHHPGQRAATGVIENLTQPRLRGALGEVAGRRPAALSPRRSKLLLNLPPVRQPIFRVPRRSALALHPQDMPVGITTEMLTPSSEADLGTYWGPNCANGRCAQAQICPLPATS